MKTEIKVFHPLCVWKGRMFITVTSVISSDSQSPSFPVHPLCLCRSFLCHFVTDPLHLTLYLLPHSKWHSLSAFFWGVGCCQPLFGRSHTIFFLPFFFFFGTSSKIDVCKHCVPTSYSLQKKKKQRSAKNQSTKWRASKTSVFAYITCAVFPVILKQMPPSYDGS